MQTVDVPRKQQRIQVGLEPETLERLEQLAEEDGRPTASQAAMLIRAAIELIDQQGFSLVRGDLRKVAIVEEED